jgi:hypothetical protein
MSKANRGRARKRGGAPPSGIQATCHWPAQQLGSGASLSSFVLKWGAKARSSAPYPLHSPLDLRCWGVRKPVTAPPSPLLSPFAYKARHVNKPMGMGRCALLLSFGFPPGLLARKEGQTHGGAVFNRDYKTGCDEACEMGLRKPPPLPQPVWNICRTLQPKELRLFRRSWTYLLTATFAPLFALRVIDAKQIESLPREMLRRCKIA